MSNLKIGRYTHESATSEYTGYIEPDDHSWIIWLGADGKPALYIAEREPGGAVTGLGIRARWRRASQVACNTSRA